jgi:hypothetical protein
MQADFRSLAVAVFDSAAKAEQSVAELRRVGFAADEIGIIEPNADTADATSADAPRLGQEGAPSVRQLGTAGAVIGGLLGAVTALVIPGIGAVIAGGVLASAMGGAALGLTAVLAGFGMSGRQTTLYEHQLEQGRTIVTVDVSGRYQEALDVLVRGGALWVDSTNTTFGANSSGTARDSVSGHALGPEPPSPARPG